MLDDFVYGGRQALNLALDLLKLARDMHVDIVYGRVPVAVARAWIFSPDLMLPHLELALTVLSEFGFVNFGIRPRARLDIANIWRWAHAFMDVCVHVGLFTNPSLSKAEIVSMICDPATLKLISQNQYGDATMTEELRNSWEAILDRTIEVQKKGNCIFILHFPFFFFCRVLSLCSRRKSLTIVFKTAPERWRFLL